MFKNFPSTIEMPVSNSIFEFHCLLTLHNGMKKVIPSVKTNIFKTRPVKRINSKIRVDRLTRELIHID